MDIKRAATGVPVAKSAHFVSTVTFSLQLHKLHSKVRTSRPPGPDAKPVNIIGPWHFGHWPGSAMRDCGIFFPRVLLGYYRPTFGAVPTHPYSQSNGHAAPSVRAA
jgi:hypothetical protein